MPATSLTQLARDHLRIAHQSTSGRSASTVFGGRERHLRQTLIAIVGGRVLDDHESPGEATLHILRGRVRLIDDTESLDGVSGEILPIPRARHRLEAMEDSVVLLTVAQLP